VVLSEAKIEVAGQFGGRDAGAAVLPHLAPLKAAARACTIGEFPFPDLRSSFASEAKSVPAASLG
jgi:hypothetical protein